LCATVCARYIIIPSMNWKIKLVLLFGKIRKPIDVSSNPNIAKMRQITERASRIGTWLFDKPVAITEVINTKADDIPVRIYKNSNAPNQRVFIYYHGGGFVLYGLNSHDNVCRRLCQMNNCIVVSVDYRLAPEHTYPAAHHDAFNALLWVRKNIAAYGGNADDLVVGGDSAGGNLSACMAHRCKEQNIKLRAQVLVYPWIDGRLTNPSITRNGEGYLLTKDTMFWFQKVYTPRVEDRCLPHVSPCFENSHANLAPAFVLTAQFDPLLDDGFNYYNQLKNAGNRVKYQEYAGLFHGFFNLPGVDAQAQKAYADIQEFLKAV
jgi:acetyl esterase